MIHYKFYAEIEDAKYTGHFFAVDPDKFYMLCNDIKVYEATEYCYQASVLYDSDIPAWYLKENCVKKTRQWVVQTILGFIKLLEENEQ